MVYRSVVFTVCLFTFAYCQTKVTQSDDGRSGKLSFTTPDLNDEEGHSPWIPDNLKCDACRIVSYQLWSRFDEYNAKNKYRNYNLKEWEILDITEQLCSDMNVFNNYGIKEVDGVHRLSGAGLETADVPGVITGGGRWPARLLDMCEDFMGRVGEENIYNVYKKHPENKKLIENFLCYGPVNTVRGLCSKGDNGMVPTDKDEFKLNDEL